MSNKIKNVQISGAVNFDGRYAITSNDFKLSDLVKVAGGFSNSAYVKGAHLSRKFTKEDLEEKTIRPNILKEILQDDADYIKHYITKE